MEKDSQLGAFEVLFRKLQPALNRYASFQLGNREEAQEEAREAVQDAFLNVWNKRDRLVFDETLKAYLYRAVRNHCLNRLKKARLDTTEIDERVMAIPDDNDWEAQRKEEMLGAIYRQVDELPGNCKEIFLMSSMEGLSHKEIAEILEISPKTVENQVGIALKKIRKGIFGTE
jgi:RNA polymerase sigma-70 factor, ECF subfamily